MIIYNFFFKYQLLISVAAEVKVLVVSLCKSTLLQWKLIFQHRRIRFLHTKSQIFQLCVTHQQEKASPSSAQGYSKAAFPFRKTMVIHFRKCALIYFLSQGYTGAQTIEKNCFFKGPQSSCSCGNHSLLSVTIPTIISIHRTVFQLDTKLDSIAHICLQLTLLPFPLPLFMPGTSCIIFLFVRTSFSFHSAFKKVIHPLRIKHVLPPTDLTAGTYSFFNLMLF